MRFPQHIHGHIEAARDIHKDRGEINSPDAVAAVLRAGRLSRESYYVGRMAAMGRADRLYPLVERMADGDADAIAFAEAESIVGIEPVDAAVRAGVLAQREDGVLSFAIPSFRRYMVERASAHRALRRDAQVLNDKRTGMWFAASAAYAKGAFQMRLVRWRVGALMPSAERICRTPAKARTRPTRFEADCIDRWPTEN